MSSPFGTSSVVDSRDPQNEIPPVSSGPESREVRRVCQGLSLARVLPSSSCQPATRTKFASVCIVAACTSSMMMNVALGPAIAISLPYAGKDLHIQKDDLQWIVNAYSISSVSISCAGVLLSSTHLAHRHVSFFLAGGLQIFMAENLSGLLAISSWPYLVSAQVSQIVCPVRFYITSSINFFIRVAGITLYILRGIQGIGCAAVVPASASLILNFRLGILTVVMPFRSGF